MLTKKLSLITLIVILFTSYAFADLLPLQGTVYNASGDLFDGDIRVYIYDNATDGTLIYDSGNDFDGEIVNGHYDILLGSNDSNPLNLIYGQLYYMDIEIDAENIDFNGNNRQLFQSSVGEIKDLNGNNSALGIGSITGGDYSNASGNYSVAIGWANTASGDGSVAFGMSNFATGTRSSVFGASNIASGYDSSAFGFFNTASGDYSSVFGFFNTVSGEASIAIGIGNTVSGNNSFASGYSSTASGNASTAFGANNVASGDFSTAFGQSNIASGLNSIAMGVNNIASGSNSLALGFSSQAQGDGSLAFNGQALSENSIAIGSYFYNGGFASSLANGNASYSIQGAGTLGDNSFGRGLIIVNGKDSFGINLNNVSQTINDNNVFVVVGGNSGFNTTSPQRTVHINDTLRIEPRASAPISPSLGDLYVDSDTFELCFYNSTAWIGMRNGSIGVCS